ncbi:MAG: glycosyltransferase family 2 protein [Dehalococcoidales bacterium]|jgi:cellulose synthase/poly-beta-1,6-N-acetylglucosamine synthase-like glycosyltransferase
MVKNGIIAALILCLFGVFLVLMPSHQTYLSFILGGASALFIILHFITTAGTRKKEAGRAAFWIPVVSLSCLFILMPAVFGAALYFWHDLTVYSWVLIVSLTFMLYYNFITLPLAVYHKHREINRTKEAKYYPSLTVMIPAYNEEKVISRTIESVLEATYPDKEIIIIDDGSKDRTEEIARSYASKGVKVIRRPNGGKATALNHGLLFARGDIIVIVDADCQICKNTLIELVQPFSNPEVAAVAGNIKVLNRCNAITRCQALEYITGINLYRRALDVFGSVSVVPGALGAYRREAMEGTGFYDSDTLVEDFDITMKALKTGKVVQASSAAISYTEAPQTIGEFVKQRLRWYRGNFQALWKHHDAAFNTRYGFLQKLSFPYMVVSMTFLPLAGLASLAAAVTVLLSGHGLMLLFTLLFFFLLQLMLSALAISLDEEDQKLTPYAVFFVIGYKQLCDFVIIKSLFDVLFHRNLKWTTVRRIGSQAQSKI